MVGHFKAFKTTASRVLRRFRQVAYKGTEFMPGHYYSTIPSDEDIGYHNSSILPLHDEINERRLEQKTLLKNLSQYYKEIDFPRNKTLSNRYYFENGFFSYSDSIFLSCLLRHIKPSRIVEIGSGFSTAAILDTCDQIINYKPYIQCIEPYPQRLIRLLRNEDSKSIDITSKKLQLVELEVFTSLGENDLLFIDSSHVCKYGSDVQHIFFKILPALRKGVIVHFHDIHHNFEYDKEWVKGGRFWNESYLLRCFMMYNDHWEIVLFGQYCHKEFPNLLSSIMPLSIEDCGGSIYLRKIR